MGGKAKQVQRFLWENPLLLFFIATTTLHIAQYPSPTRWLISGAPFLSFVLLQGDVKGNRVLSFAHIWPLLATVNLAYAIASTSWLLFWVFTVLCYPTIFLTSLFHFKIVGTLTRLMMRAFIRHVLFVDDKIALFNIPALEIDTEVNGLLVLRGITFSLSTLSFLIHGVEVGIKLSDDLELAIQTETVKVSLFKSIEVGDCYASLKGGQYEMATGHMAEKSVEKDGDTLVAAISPDLKATLGSRPELVKMKSEMTNEKPPKDSLPKAAIKDVERQTPQKDSAGGQYRRLLESIDDTSTIRQARRSIEKQRQNDNEPVKATDPVDMHALRAAICSELHSKPSVPNPPTRSVKVTTLQKVTSPRVKHFLHRLPMLLRLLLSLLSYLHPVTISSITATASGRWIRAMLIENMFKEYSDSDSELRDFNRRISAWVSDANFIVTLGTMVGHAQVPLNSTQHINCRLEFKDVVAYRMLPEDVRPNQAFSLSGADAVFAVPTFLLPHHEHLVPSAPIKRPVGEMAKGAEDEPGDHKLPDLEQDDKDEAAVKMSVHVRLPAIFSQELLDFIAILAKASKLVEMEQAMSPTEDGENKLRDLTGALNLKMKYGFAKAVLASDQWLARLTGKIMKGLEEVSGDVGYSGDIPVGLGSYRETGWFETEGGKLLA